jgi:hypothetical protein
MAARRPETTGGEGDRRRRGPPRRRARPPEGECAAVERSRDGAPWPEPEVETALCTRRGRASASGGSGLSSRATSRRWPAVLTAIGKPEVSPNPSVPSFLHSLGLGFHTGSSESKKNSYQFLLYSVRVLIRVTRIHSYSLPQPDLHTRVKPCSGTNVSFLGSFRCISSG